MQELEETVYWMELISESKLFENNIMKDLMEEANELTAILTTCVKNAKKRDAG